MKQLKFRLWDKQLSRMYYPGDGLTDVVLMHFDKEGALDSIQVGEAHEEWEIIGGSWRKGVEGTCSEPMQSTGLYDMKGKEVYAGDIIATRYKSHSEKKGHYVVYNEIAFQNGAFGYISEIDRKEFCSIEGVGLTDAEVVGNVFENPALVALDSDENAIYQQAKFKHVRDLEPIQVNNLTNFIEYQAAFVEMQKADSFAEESIRNTDWDSVRNRCFNQSMTVKEAFQHLYYE